MRPVRRSRTTLDVVRKRALSMPFTLIKGDGIDTMESLAAGPIPAEATSSILALAHTNGGTESAPAYIYATQVGPTGKLIAFVYSGECHHTSDGSKVHLTPDDIMDSVNIQQLKRGLAYPMFYDTLFYDLRERMREVSEKAKAAGAGLWPRDKTTQQGDWTGSVKTLPPIFPKLWRRINAYQNDKCLFDSVRPFANLTFFIEKSRNERVYVPDQNRFTGFDDVIETTDDTVRMNVDPHNLVIISQH